MTTPRVSAELDAEAPFSVPSHDLREQAEPIPSDLLKARTCASCYQPIGKHKTCDGTRRLNPSTPCTPPECQSGWQRTDHSADCPAIDQAMFAFVSYPAANALDNLHRRMAGRSSRWR